MKRAIILAVAALSACQQSESKDVPAPRVADQNTLKVGSKVVDLRIVPASVLPANPKPGPVAEYCSAYVIAKPKSAGAKLAAKNGWIVTSEVKLGSYDAVTFVGALDPMTSATCVHLNGNLAIFGGGRLKAIAYEPKPPKGTDPNDLASSDSIGFADQIDPRRIRLYWGLPSPPFADVVLHDGIFVEPTAKEDLACKGAARVPNIYLQEIHQARIKLRSYGWQPVRHSPQEEMWAVEQELYGDGVIEVESCAGTGFGFCAFNYRHKRGFSLRVITAGEEDYRVNNYQVECGGSESH